MRLALVSVTRGELVLREEVSRPRTPAMVAGIPAQGGREEARKSCFSQSSFPAEELVKMLLLPRAQSPDPQTMI